MGRGDTGRKLTALVGLDDGRIVGLVEYGFQPASVVVGVAHEPLTEHAVTSSRTFRDGGTRHVGTAAGMLQLPNPLGDAHPERPTWDGAPGTSLDPDDHVLVPGDAPSVVPKTTSPAP